MNRRTEHAELAARVDRILGVGQALHRAGAPVGRVEATVETLGQVRGLDIQCLAGPTSIQLVHDGQARLVRTDGAGIDLSAQAHLSRAVSAEVAGDPSACANALQSSGPRSRAPWAEVGLWGLLALTVAIGMGGTDGTVLAAGILGVLVGALVATAEEHSGLGALVPLAGALLASAGATFLSALWPLDPVVAPMAAIIVLLPGWSLTVGVGEVATGHLASGAARLTGAFVTVLQLALGWSAGAEAVAMWDQPPALHAGPLIHHTLPEWVGILGVAACFALLFRADGRHFAWVTAGVVLAWLSGHVPAHPMVQSYVGALLIGLLGAGLTRTTGLPGQLVTVPGVMLMVPGGALLVAVLRLVRHDPDGLTTLVDALGVSGVLVGGLLTARLLLPPRATPFTSADGRPPGRQPPR